MCLEQQWGCGQEITTVGDHVPVASKPAHSLHGLKIDHAGLKDLIGWHRAIDHTPLHIMPLDGGSAQSLEYAYLNFLWIEPDQFIKS